MRVVKWIAIVVLAFGIVAQAFRPDRTNPPIDDTKTLRANSSITPEVAAIVDRSCSDCHSSKTVWPWYSQVAPASWLVASDVSGGRRHWSASEWGTYDAAKRVHLLQQMCEDVQADDMPESQYLWLHPQARLTDADKQAICDWTKREAAGK